MNATTPKPACRDHQPALADRLFPGGDPISKRIDFTYTQ